MIQVIPFHAEQEPFFLPLLGRGLTDLAMLRLNGSEIAAQVNQELKFTATLLETPVSAVSPDHQDLWLVGVLAARRNGNQGEDLAMNLGLLTPEENSLVYCSSFQMKETEFLEEWERQLQQIIAFLTREQDSQPAPRKMFTRSLEAFLSFRKGLENISQARSERSREEGLNDLLEAVAYDPEFTEAADVFILFLMQNGIGQDFERVVGLLERLRQIAVNHPRVPLVLAEVYSQSGDQVKTEQLLLEVVAAFPRFTEGRIRLALFYHGQNQSPEALAALQAILEYEPENATALDLSGAIQAGLGQRELAEKLWEQVVALDPERVNVLNNLGLLAEEDGLLEKAEAYYQKSIQINENWWGSFYHYGAFCRRHDRLEEAALWFEKATALNQEHFQSWHGWSLTLIQLGRYGEAQEALLKLLQIAPDNQTRRQVLQMLDRLKDPEIKMESRLRFLERLWDQGGRAWNKWSVLWEMLRLWPRARRRWYFWYLWGRIWQSLNLKWPASLCWSRGMGYEPGFPLLKRLGLYYWEKGCFAKALPVLRQAFPLNQSDQDTAQAYLQTLVNLGALDELHANLEGLSQFNSRYRSFLS